MVSLDTFVIIIVSVIFILNCKGNGSTDVIQINQRICENYLDCGVSFNDISGELGKYVEFKAEYLLENAGFDGSVWVKDDHHPRRGYLLFVLLGPLGSSGLYKLNEEHGEISVELIVLSNSSADVAWTCATPNKAYITSLTGQKIVVVDIINKQIIKEYTQFNGQSFAGPDGIYADDHGNVYFTDTDYNVFDPVPNTLPGGSLFRINALSDSDEVYLEGTVGFGYNGICINNIYGGNGRRLVVSNTVDLPDDIYQIDDNSVWNPQRIFIGEYMKRNDGTLKRRGRYYSITEDMDRFPKKTFLDGMTFDAYDNLYVSVIVNQTISKVVVLNYNDCSDDNKDGFTDYIGEIVFAEGFAVNAITLAGDGYFYASLVNFPEFSIGQFVRFRAKGRNCPRERDRNGWDKIYSYFGY